MKDILVKALKEIKSNTGLDVDVYSSDGRFLCSTGGEANFSAVPDLDDGECLFQDKKEDLTVFRIDAHTLFLGIIKGADKLAYNYAQLLRTLLAEIILKNESTGSDQDCIKDILLGNSSVIHVQNYIQKLGIKPGKIFVVSIEIPTKGQNEVLQFLTSFSEDLNDMVVRIDDELVAYVRFITEVNDYRSSQEFVNVLNENVYEETGVSVHMGIGSVVDGFFDIQTSYKQAAGAMEMGRVLQENVFVHPFNDYIFMKMFDDIPKQRLQQYFDYLLNNEASEILKDEEMLSTAETFLNNNLNLSETSRKLYMHRNTLTYRIDKLQKIMGLDIRNFSDAVTFRIITILYKLLKGNLN